MKTKLFYVVMALAMVLSLGAAIVPASPVEAVGGSTSYYVSTSGNDTATGTSWDTAWKTITHAVSSVSATEHDTINVAAGTYDEQVVIDKSLTLQGAGITTIIQPTTVTQTFNRKKVGTTESEPTNAIVVATVNVGAPNSVTIKDLKIDSSQVTNWGSGNKNVSILYQGAAGTIDNITFTGGASVGDVGDCIYASAFEETVAVEIKNCDMGTSFYKNGITCNYAGLTANIHNNTVTGAGSIDTVCQNGIQIGFGATGSMAANTVSNIAYTGTDYVAAGILVWNSTGVTITGNTITNCQKGVTAQTNEAGSHTVTISNNIISNAGLSADLWYVAGISVAAWDPGTITATINNNDLTGGGPNDGIDCYGDAGTVDATITNNEVSGWTWSGIWMDASADTVTITGNTITNNGVAGSDGGGIDIYSDADVTNFEVHNNNIVGNADYGIHNAAAGTLDAENNWWGSNYGPEDASGTTECTGPAAWNCGECDKNTEPVGELGDAVSDNVDYCPWLGHEAGIVYIEGVPGVHYPSIQAAIDAVTGTTILVGAGTYNEQLFIDQSMTIKSLDGADVTIIDGSGLTDLFWEVPLDGTTMTIYPVVWIDAAQVVFGAADQGFTITGATVYDPREGEEPPVEMGVGMLNRAAGCIIEDNIFDNNTIAGYMGMYMYESGSSNNQILDNEFCGNVMALWLMGGGGDTISGNSGNTFIENYLAIGLQMSNDNDIVGNTLRSNSMGIDLEGSHGNTISGNDISDTTGDDWVMGNTTIDGVAIELIGSNDNTISGNTISKDTEGHEAEWGIRLSGSSNNDIVGNNDISDCQYDGILLRGGYDDPQYGWIGPSNENLVQGNEVYDCDIGIAIEQSDNNDVLDNEVYGCATGIYLSSQGSGNEIGRAGEGNTVYYCEGGIMVEDSWDETVAGNTVYDCCVGIHLLNSHNITVEDNTTWADVEGESEVGMR